MAYTALLSKASEILAKVCIAITLLGLISVSVCCWFWRAEILGKRDALEYAAVDVLDELESEAAWYMFFFILSISLAVVFSIIIYCYREQLQMALDCIDASADFLYDTYRIIWTPIAHFLMQILVIFLWCGSMAQVMSLNEIEASSVYAQLRIVKWSDDVWKLCLFMIFGLLWLCALLDYLNNFIVITAASTFYWNNDRQETQTQKPADVRKAWKIAYCNHLGTIAFGSLVLAITRFFKYTFVFLAQKIEE